MRITFTLTILASFPSDPKGLTDYFGLSSRFLRKLDFSSMPGLDFKNRLTGYEATAL